MIAVNNERKANETNWQSSFVVMLPEIERRLRRAFCHLGSEARENAVAEAIVHSLFSYSRLFERNRAETASPSTLAWYAAKQVKRGRPAGNRMNGKEPLSRYAQLRKEIRIERLHAYSAIRDEWIDMIVSDKRAAVADQVAARMDLRAWFATLSRRMRQVAKDLALGFSTSEVAQKHQVTPGRISQLRRTLEASWAEFQHQCEPALAR